MKKLIIGTLTALMIFSSTQGIVSASIPGNNLVSKTSVNTGAGKQVMTDKNVVIKAKGYNIWNDFSFSKSRNNSTVFFGKTLHVKCYYVNANGNTYYSLYDSSDKWVGYINKNAASEITAQCIIQNVSINAKGLNLWNNLAFESAKIQRPSIMKIIKT